ncbi:MAG: fumarylacetoacetate hydrolase family protein [Saccharolobus sp.]|uniref:Fumarylacetoacetate hydrolase family protein n=1 Tax=Saccharolobus shibatae (strain ATCC 51178 / DSM 5389 / JCM 8931 / NBRC 15437 / B12) TaxID=523848 RepID=A0A8F5BPE3_SACSH|nr:fumarylacetoacetate hydrolase family protein [Saccharolobus shibatae]MCH4815848.1 fumarylacetoacetate hydrolase family protein [Saccharolobus shibatae]QXJ28900.1 Fumarylacetoacetate hydrolase family protein [Saccharolobus shibatae B12]
MRLLSFYRGSPKDSRVGIVYKDGKIIDLAYLYEYLYGTPPDWLTDLTKLLEGGSLTLKLVNELVNEFKKLDNNLPGGLLDEDSVMFLPVVKPKKIFCVAVNYNEHGKEAGSASIEEPYIFMKRIDTLVAHKQPILIPKVSSQVDHEIELAVIIGKKGKYISAKEAYEYIAGYTIFNDVSFRDLRKHSSPRYNINWLYAKNLDTASPIGPYLVTRDEIPDPHNLTIKLEVNGEIRQQGNTRSMIHKIPELIEYVSKGITLYPGDVISTGTPSGTGLGTGKFLKEGDVMVGYIEKIGRLENRVMRE